MLGRKNTTKINKIDVHDSSTFQNRGVIPYKMWSGPLLKPEKTHQFAFLPCDHINFLLRMILSSQESIRSGTEVTASTV